MPLRRSLFALSKESISTMSIQKKTSKAKVSSPSKDNATHPFDRIREGARDASPALTVVAQWMLRHTAQAATLGIEDIAEACGSSPASVNRMARAAGYAGFAELKSELALVM